MKLPKLKDKFVVNRTYEGEQYSFYGFVVSGVHIEIRGDDDNPDFVWYFVYADKVYDGLFHGGCLYAAMCLQHALDFIAQYLVPYKESEEEIEKGSVVEKEDNEDAERFEQRCVYSYNFEIPDYSDVFSSGVCIGHSFSASSGFSDKISWDCVIPEAAAALNHMFDSFNSLAADLLHMQYILTPAPTGGGGAAAYA